MVFIGLISYSLYLWHWPLLAIDRATRIGQAPLSVRIALISAAVPLAWLSYRSVEQPLRRPDPIITDRKVLVAAVLVLASFAWSLWLVCPFFDRIQQPNDLASRTQYDVPEARQHCHYQEFQSLADFPRQACIATPGLPVAGSHLGRFTCAGVAAAGYGDRQSAKGVRHQLYARRVRPRARFRQREVAGGGCDLSVVQCARRQPAHRNRYANHDSTVARIA
jgi:hypothetical protein